MRSIHISRRRFSNHTSNNCIPWPCSSSSNPSRNPSRLRFNCLNIQQIYFTIHYWSPTSRNYLNHSSCNHFTISCPSFLTPSLSNWWIKSTVCKSKSHRPSMILKLWIFWFPLYWIWFLHNSYWWSSTRWISTPRSWQSNSSTYTTWNPTTDHSCRRNSLLNHSFPRDKNWRNSGSSKSIGLYCKPTRRILRTMLWNLRGKSHIYTHCLRSRRCQIIRRLNILF